MDENRFPTDPDSGVARSGDNHLTAVINPISINNALCLSCQVHVRGLVDMLLVVGNPEGPRGWVRYRPTRERMIAATGGMDVNSTVTVPKRLMERLERAAARGSVRRRTAVAMALELTPRVTPLVT